MEKLDVAIRLLRLLNERKELDSKTVAHELNVSLRTAQRYLTELSLMPCVTHGRNHSIYLLDTSYELNKAIIHAAHKGDEELTEREKTPMSSISKAFCQTCEAAENYACSGSRSEKRPVSNKDRIDKLCATLLRRLTKRCRLP